MDINGVWLNDFERIVNRVSREQYAGNLKVNDDAHPLRVSRRDHLRGLGNTRARLVTKDSYAYGSRTTWSGRHGRYASWEAYRDVLMALFDEYPDARVRTGMADYKGAEGFLANYPATAHKNIGSPINPVTMPQLSVGTRPAVDFMALNRDESARLAALAAERLAENAANPGMIALREYVAAHPENWIDGQANPIAFMDAATDAENDYADRMAAHTLAAAAWEREARRARAAAWEREITGDARADRPASRFADHNNSAESTIQEINKLLAEVAEEGWTNPYEHEDSPARKLA